MKRKYLSALLMGTLTVASMSTFTSCKDYDDDISNLQEQIDKLATADQLSQKVAELQALISSNQSGISSLETKLAEVKATADSKATLDQVKEILAGYATNESVTKEANEIVNAAIKALQDKDIAELKAAIEAAKEEAAKGVQEAKDANADVLKTLTEDYVTKKEVEEVQNALNTAIEALKTDNAKALQEAVDKIYDDLEAYAKQEKLNEVESAAKATQQALEEAIAAQKTKDEAAQLAAQQKLDAAVKTLEEKISTAQKAGDDAKQDAADNASEIETLAKTVKTAGENLAKVQENLTKVENAVKTLGTGFDEKNTVAAAIQAINGQLTAKNTGLAGLDERLSAVEAALKGDEDGDKLPNLKLQVDNIENKLKDIIGQYSTMVTDVQLYNFTTASNPGFDNELKFIQATEQANVFPGAGVADAQFTFEKGKYFVGEDSLLIRVSPVDAELTTSNVSLLNSQGKELNDLIEVTDAHRYSDLLYGKDVPTRAAGVDANTGLWVVKFKAKDLGDAFKAAAETKVNNVNKYVLYSVAVKNTYTTDEAKDRRVTSEYCVNLSSAEAKHAYDFTVNKTSIKNIFNRYAECPTVEELVWKNNAKPATTVVKDNPVADKNNAVNRPDANNDNRKDEKILAVEKGGDIVIDFTKQIPGLSGAEQNKDFGVKGFYVTLDEKFAQESGVSEINAWRSYSYVNVGYKKSDDTVVPAKLFTGNKGIIKINDMGNVKGDVIGFRVYAVNYDGTLTDPDGRAFYVAVGDAKVDMTIPATTVSIDMTTASDNQPKFVSPKVAVDFSKYDFDTDASWSAAEKYVWAVTAEDKDKQKPTEFTVRYFDENGAKVDHLSKDVKSVQFVLTKPNKFIDDETYTVSLTLKKKIAGATAEVGTVTASFKKVMPTEAPTFSYRDGFDKFEYIIPTGGYKVNEPGDDGKIANKDGKFNLRQILIINNNKTWNDKDLFDESNAGVFKFNVANGQYDANVKLATASATGPDYMMAVNNSGKNLVDNTTERTIAAVYNYKDISKRPDPEDNGKIKEFKYFPVNSESSEKIVYCSWMKTFGYDVKSNIVEEERVVEYEVIDENTGDPVKKYKKVKVPVEHNTWLNSNTVEWKSDGNGGKTLNLENLAVSVADYKLLPVTTGLSGARMDKFFASGVIAIVGNVYTTSIDGTQKNPYFNAETVKTTAGTESYISGIKLSQKSQQAIPSKVTGGKIHFTIRDCFGNTKAIELPFKIKVNAVNPARKH